MNKILLIEDKIQSKKFYLNHLLAEDFHTITAQNGLTGIQYAKELSPDLIICDTMMQDIDGYSILGTLRQHPATAIIPFIFLSAKGSYTDIRRGMDLGADDYIIKPCKIENILKAIKAQLEKRTTLKQWYSHEIQRVSSSQSIFPNCSKLNQVFRYIEENYRQPIKLSDVALAVGYSPTYLTSLVKRETKHSVHCWITKRRMTEACFLLINSDELVNEIAAKVGYSDAGHFIRQFRQIHKIPPKVWRNEHWRAKKSGGDFSREIFEQRDRLSLTEAALSLPSRGRISSSSLTVNP